MNQHVNKKNPKELTFLPGILELTFKEQELTFKEQELTYMWTKRTLRN